MFESQIPVLAERELPGPNTWNSVARFLRGMESRIEFLTLNSRPGGGVYFDIDLNKLRQFIEQLEGKIVEGNTFTLPTRTVYLGGGTIFDTISVASRTVTVSETMCAWVEIHKTSASYKVGSAFHSLVSVEDKILRWPICTLTLLTDDNGRKSVSVNIRHQGDICIPTMPHFWLDGYTTEKMVVRACDEGREYYEETGTCE